MSPLGENSMPVFISYSHENKDFVDVLAAQLVLNKASVWVDRWELKVGDSLLQNIETAITNSSALLIILSKASVDSEWCRRELTAGLTRELEERKVLVLPVLLEDCKIPLFLKDKIYADFRSDYDIGLSAVLEGIAPVTNADQGRIESASGTLDWAEDWGWEGDLFQMRYTIVQCPDNLPMTFLTEVIVLCDEGSTKRYKQYEDVGLDWVGRMMIAQFLHDVGDKKEFRIILDNQMPKKQRVTLQDTNGHASHELFISCRKLGEDNGKSQLISISDYLKQIRNYIFEIGRRPTMKEKILIAKIINTPYGK